MVKYGIWRPGKPAFRDAGLESRNARLSRPVISYAQYQMAPLVIAQCSSSFVQLIVRIALDARINLSKTLAVFDGWEGGRT